MSTYIWNILEWFSQGLNTVFLAGNPNMTVSARCWVNRERSGWSRAYHAINRVFFWQADHCRQSYEDDLRFARSVLPPPPEKHVYYPPGGDPIDQ
ncbi:hypothetical protein [Hydrogenophaga defluvii]|uniref:Uncharacterized protein n=1 Tax=Hydrogenophaga defluvii TaxID=249410 RepID=A0ABW2SCC9_9BURK